MHTVNTDHALPVVNISQFSTMTADRRGVAMPLYTVPSAVLTVTAAAPLQCTPLIHCLMTRVLVRHHQAHF